MRKLYLHIGTEKTGTTSIQHFLKKNEAVLSENGYHLLNCSGAYNHRAIASYCMPDNAFDDFFLSKKIDTLEKKQKFKEELRRVFNKEIEALNDNIHSVIITSEHFHSRLKKIEDVEKLKDLLSNYFSEIEIICYLREQSALASSLYSTGVKSGLNIEFALALKNCSPSNPFYNYYSLLERWSKVFSFANLNVRIFSKGEFYNNNLIDDFCMTMNKELLTITDKKVKIENEALSNLGIIIGRAINSLSSKYDQNGFINKERKHAFEQIVENFHGHENNISLEQYENIYNKFQETNQKVAQKYFKNREHLFPWKPLPLAKVPINENQIKALSNIINNFKSVSLDSEANVNLLRGAAVLLEEVNISMANKLMKLAKKTRPNGAFIKSKIKAYTKCSLKQKIIIKWNDYFKRKK